MALYGIYGSHTTESCPLYDAAHRQWLIATVPTFGRAVTAAGMRMLSAYHSALEHTFVWMIEADHAHAIQDLMVESNVAKWNALKIVPLSTLQDVFERCQTLEAAAKKNGITSRAT